MTTLFTVLTPAPGITPEQFHEHWRHPHGTLASRLSALRSYVQNHRIAPDGIALPEDRAEGVVRVELQDGATAAAIGEDPLYADHLAADERRFIDLDVIRPYATEVVSIGPVSPAPRPGDAGTTGTGAPADELNLSTPTDDLADGTWSPETTASAITLIRFSPDEPNTNGDHARRLGASWHAVYRITGETGPGDSARFVEQFWWPTIARCREHASGEDWLQLTDTSGGVRVLLAACERLL